MRKILAMVLGTVLTLSLLAGCSGGGTGSGGGAADTGSSTATAEASGAAAPAADSGDAIKIKIAHTDSSARSTNTWAEWLGTYLEENAPGRFVVEVYPDGQLGDTTDVIAGLGLGTVEMVFDLASCFTQVAGDASACIDLPYLYPSFEDWEKGMLENGGLELFNEYIADVDFYCIDLYYNGIREIISRNKIYHNAADFAGQKVRIAQNDLNVEIWNAMGANPTPMAWAEVVTSLSQGQIDALDHSLGVFNDFNLHEIAPYVTLTNHCSSPFPIIVSKSWIEALDPADREVLEEGVRQMAAGQRAEERANEEGYIKRFRDEGAEVYELTAEETAAFLDACQPVYDWMRNRAGDEVVDKWLATVPQ